MNLQERLSQTEFQYIGKIAAISASYQFKVYLIGGMVRDLILQKETIALDIDITIDGDAVLVASEFSSTFSGHLTLYEKFLTATVDLQNYSIDFATLRKESYERSGDLPNVSKGSFENEILRRDFTINSIALSLNEGNFGEVIDLTGGISDIEKGIIRVLHQNSFKDDPTRIFRAARFIGRLGYKFEAVSKRLLNEALNQNVFKNISQQRIANELRIIINEEKVDNILAFMFKTGVLAKVSMEIIYNKKTKMIIKKLKAYKKPDNQINSELYLYAALLYQSKSNNIAEAISVFCLEKKLKDEVSKICELKQDFCFLDKNYDLINEYKIYKTLNKYSKEILFVLKASGDFKNSAQICLRFFRGLKKANIYTNGEDLKVLGIAPGKIYATLLEKVREKRINGELKTMKDEKAFLMDEIKTPAIN